MSPRVKLGLVVAVVASLWVGLCVKLWFTPPADAPFSDIEALPGLQIGMELYEAADQDAVPTRGEEVVYEDDAIKFLKPGGSRLRIKRPGHWFFIGPGSLTITINIEDDPAEIERFRALVSESPGPPEMPEIHGYEHAVHAGEITLKRDDRSAIGFQRRQSAGDFTLTEWSIQLTLEDVVLDINISGKGEFDVDYWPAFLDAIEYKSAD